MLLVFIDYFALNLLISQCTITWFHFHAGAQATTPTFGSSGFGQSNFGGQQRGGSRVTPYTPTTEADAGTGAQPAGKLESISAMPVYKEKSHEELRWEDYQLGDKGNLSAFEILDKLLHVYSVFG